MMQIVKYALVLQDQWYYYRVVTAVFVKIVLHRYINVPCVVKKLKILSAGQMHKCFNLND